MPDFKEKDIVAFQFGSEMLIGTIIRMITPLRAVIYVSDEEKEYEVDCKDLFLYQRP